MKDDGSDCPGGEIVKPVDILVIGLVAGLLVLAFWLNRRRKTKSSCCGDCAKCRKGRGDGQKGC